MNGPEQWSATDAYIEQRIGAADLALESLIENNRKAGLAPIDVSPLQGRFLALMVQVSKAKRILEIGTLGGYSAIVMARALPDDGTLISLEYDPATADVARANIAGAGMDGKVEVITGAALDTLPTLSGLFDMIFIDADKKNNAAYLEWAIKLSRAGSLIIVDNVVRSGAIIDPTKTDPHTAGNRAMFDAMQSHTCLETTALQTVGSKGWDGFLMAVVKG